MSKESAREKKVVPLARKGGNCPICQAPSENAHRPFCSRRCADLDLGRWLKGSYRIAGEPAELAEDGPDSAQLDRPLGQDDQD